MCNRKPGPGCGHGLELLLLDAEERQQKAEDSGIATVEELDALSDEVATASLRYHATEEGIAALEEAMRLVDPANDVTVFMRLPVLIGEFIDLPVHRRIFINANKEAAEAFYEWQVDMLAQLELLEKESGLQTAIDYAVETYQSLFEHEVSIEENVDDLQTAYIEKADEIAESVPRSEDGKFIIGPEDIEAFEEPLIRYHRAQYELNYLAFKISDLEAYVRETDIVLLNQTNELANK